MTGALARVSAIVCVSVTACQSPDPLQDERVHAASEVLEVAWREGATWSVEVQGTRGSFKTNCRFWGITHYVVAELRGKHALVDVRFVPVFDHVSPWPACSARLHIGLHPWRLHRVHLSDAAGELRLEAEDGAGEPPASPCLLFAPRHPLVPYRADVSSHLGQAIAIDGDDVTFELSGIRRHGWREERRVLRWPYGAPWWTQVETIERDGVPPLDWRPPVPESRLRDGMVIDRARLVAVDGAAIRPRAWTMDRPSEFREYQCPDDPEGLGPEGLLTGDDPLGGGALR
jgi:hypothetical protein